jgi:hypothetical protein
MDALDEESEETETRSIPEVDSIEEVESAAVSASEPKVFGSKFSLMNPLDYVRRSFGEKSPTDHHKAKRGL